MFCIKIVKEAKKQKNKGCRPVRCVSRETLPVCYAERGSVLCLNGFYNVSRETIRMPSTLIQLIYKKHLSVSQKCRCAVAMFFVARRLACDIYQKTKKFHVKHRTQGGFECFT